MLRKEHDYKCFYKNLSCCRNILFRTKVEQVVCYSKRIYLLFLLTLNKLLFFSVLIRMDIQLLATKS